MTTEHSNGSGAIRLVQYKSPDGERHVGRVSSDGNHLQPLSDTASVMELAEAAIDRGINISSLVEERSGTAAVDYDELLRLGLVLAPLDHPEPARFLVTGTGLTHTGSASARNQMHTLTHGKGASESDSSRSSAWGSRVANRPMAALGAAGVVLQGCRDLRRSARGNAAAARLCQGRGRGSRDRRPLYEWP